MINIRNTFQRFWTWLLASTPVPEIRNEPSDWCLVGNVVDEHKYGESGEILRGSEHFRPGTKVYCLPPQWGDGYYNIVVVGLSRGSRRWITVVLPRRLIKNWRAKVVYKPAVIRRLRAGFEGFNRQWESQEQVESWAASLRTGTS